MFGSRFSLLSKGALIAATALAITAFAPVANARGVVNPQAAQLSQWERSHVQHSYAMAPFATVSPSNTNKSAICVNGYRWIHLDRTSMPVRCAS